LRRRWAPDLCLDPTLPQFADQIRQIRAQRVGQIAIRGVHRDGDFPGALSYADVHAAVAIYQMPG
jgi:hypothetical protein